MDDFLTNEQVSQIPLPAHESVGFLRVEPFEIYCLRNTVINNILHRLIEQGFR